MKSLKDYFSNLYAIDLLIISFAFLLSILNLVFNSKIELWIEYIFINTVFTIFVLFIANIRLRKESIILEQIHNWYILPTIFLVFKEIYYMIKPISGADCDSYLIAIDKFIFGVHPTQFLYHYSNPILTEILQISYASFFILPIILLVELQTRKQILNFRFVAFSLVLGFTLSYIGYFLVPAIGPRFTLHNFETTNIELPGLFLTKYLREIINAGEAIPAGTPNPIDVVQRDVFPSGHTQMTLITMYLSLKLKSKFRYLIYSVGTLLILATVYLRYHYVIDLFGGLVFMILTMFLSKYLFNRWNLRNKKECFEYPIKTKIGNN